MTAAWHRVRQFAKALVARVGPQEGALARQVLPPGAAGLFGGMARPDQRHALDMLGALRRQGQDAPELLAAGLLHDVAKSGRVRTWHRVVWVLLERWRPQWLQRLAVDDGASWRSAFWVQQHHADLSARLAETAGCSVGTVELIRHHHDGAAELPAPLADWLRALQAADDELGDRGV